MSIVREQYNSAYRYYRLVIPNAVQIWPMWDHYEPIKARVWSDKTNDGLIKFIGNIVDILWQRDEIESFPKSVQVNAANSFVGAMLTTKARKRTKDLAGLISSKGSVELKSAIWGSHRFQYGYRFSFDTACSMIDTRRNWSRSVMYDRRCELNNYWGHGNIR